MFPTSEPIGIPPQTNPVMMRNDYDAATIKEATEDLE
jgi:hypothetical protein